MHELILHLLGDYVLQTEQMAVRKLQSWLWATIHALVYSIPFFLYLGMINGNWTSGLTAWFVIFSTHAFIDRLALARTICRLKNLVWLGEAAPEREEFTGYGADTPPFIRFWLVVIVDNTFHMLINHVALNYLNP